MHEYKNKSETCNAWSCRAGNEYSLPT